MPRFRFSVLENWSRIYLVEAKTLEEAKQKYHQYVHDGWVGEDIYAYDPEYVDDVQSGLIIYDEEGNILDDSTSTKM